MVNPVNQILTVNLEDYFQVTPVSEIVPVGYWSRFERRVERNTAATLDMLDRHHAKATFFVSGWIADAAPEVVREVVKRGHRVAAKGYLHEFPTRLSLEEFFVDARRAKDALERTADEEVLGYRAARGGIDPDDSARFAALADAGYAYDSSVRPLGFGATAANVAFPVGCGAGQVIELPITAATALGYTYPVGGGNFLRQLPAVLTLPRIARAAKDPAQTLVFYFHVWELDPDMPRLNGVSRLNRIRQYRNLDAMRERIEGVLAAHAFASAEDVLALERHVIRPVAKSVAAAPAAKGEGEPLTLVVPCHNEAESLPFLDRTLALLADKLAGRYRLSFVFVDDASTDDTHEVLQKTFGGREDVRIVTHETNRGVSAAIMSGIAAARTDLVASIDCDCSYDPFQVEALLERMQPGVAMVTASPYHRDGHVLNVPAWRLMLSRGLSVIYGTLLRHKFATYTSCFRVYRRPALAGVALEHGNYLGIAELLIRLDQAGRKLAEAPATLEARLFGRSKMKTLRTIAGHLRLIGDLAAGKFKLETVAKSPPVEKLEKDRG
ncbi:MAG: glycosyltransferase [Rhodobiaceae bacterium]|nr:glycosyltransferase [Rhodobiaceae bacterium]MCC0052971.1 glycosyltransferase [Rhodobiaceae bacterium]